MSYPFTDILVCPFTSFSRTRCLFVSFRFLFCFSHAIETVENEGKGRKGVTAVSFITSSKIYAFLLLLLSLFFFLGGGFREAGAARVAAEFFPAVIRVRSWAQMLFFISIFFHFFTFYFSDFFVLEWVSVVFGVYRHEIATTVRFPPGFPTFQYMQYTALPPGAAP